MTTRGTPLGLSRGDLESLRRRHVTNPLYWANEPATDYWIIAAANGMLTASGQNLITDGGWTATSLAVADGSAADFLSKSDVGTPGEITTNAAADLLESPAIFGDYAHAHAAAVIMGQRSLPRYLVMDAYARFSVASADELTTNLGFVEDGGSIVVSADIMAAIYSDSANWCIQANAVESKSTTLTVDNDYHWFRILMDKATSLSYGYLDGTLINSIAITADEFPVSWGFGNGTTNRIQLNQAHIFYDWRVPPDPQVW